MTDFCKGCEIVSHPNYLLMSQKTETVLLAEMDGFSSQRCEGQYLVQKHWPPTQNTHFRVSPIVPFLHPYNMPFIIITRQTTGGSIFPGMCYSNCMEGKVMFSESSMIQDLWKAGSCKVYERKKLAPAQWETVVIRSSALLSEKSALSAFPYRRKYSRLCSCQVFALCVLLNPGGGFSSTLSSGCMLKAPMWLQEVLCIVFLSYDRWWWRVNVMGNRCAGVGNCSGKGKEQVSSTSFVQGNIQELFCCLDLRKSSCFPLLFPTDSCGSWTHFHLDLVEGCVLHWTGKWIKTKIYSLDFETIFLTIWFKRYLGCFLLPINGKREKSEGLEVWDYITL